MLRAVSRVWTCGLCGGSVIEGQRFTFIGGIGAVHVECFNKRALSTASESLRDLVALLDVNEVLLYAITRFKGAERVASSEEVRGAIADARREVERLAGKIASLLGSLEGGFRL